MNCPPSSIRLRRPCRWQARHRLGSGPVEPLALHSGMCHDRTRRVLHGLADRRGTGRRHRLGPDGPVAGPARGRAVSRDALCLCRSAGYRADAADPQRTLCRADGRADRLYRHAARCAEDAHAAQLAAEQRGGVPQRRLLRLSHPPDHERHSRAARGGSQPGRPWPRRRADALAFLSRVQAGDGRDRTNM